VVDKNHPRPGIGSALKNFQTGIYRKGNFSQFGAIVVNLKAV
jgi:hypothetical protein